MISNSIQVFRQEGKELYVREDEYINATLLCKNAGKQLGHYLELDTTKQFLGVLSSVLGITISTLVQIKRGGNPKEQGTWVHPKVAPNLGQWLSPEYAVWVAITIEEIHSQSIPIHTLPEWLTRAELNEGGVPKGFFSVISKAYLVYKLLKQLGYIVPDRADDGKVILLEGSLGYWWLKYLKEHHPKYSENIRTYTHVPLKGSSVQAKCYPKALLGAFELFVENDWIPNQAYRYFSERDFQTISVLSKALTC